MNRMTHIITLYNSTISRQEIVDLLSPYGHVQIETPQPRLYPLKLMVDGEFIDAIDIHASRDIDAREAGLIMFRKATPYDISLSPDDPELLLTAENITLDMVQIDA
jgi:hypothetical protein